MKSKIHEHNKNIKNIVSKNSIKLIALVFLTIFAMSCSKDEEPAPIQPIALEPLQDPLTGCLLASGFNQKTANVVNGLDYEFGYSFIPLINGKMTAIVAKIPDVRLAMRVKVWNKATEIVLKSETIDIATANVEVIKQIAPLNLIKDKEYLLTFNSNDWYDRRKTAKGSVTYPFTVGDIKITSYSHKIGTAQVIPDSPQTTYYARDCSFKFQK